MADEGALDAAADDAGTEDATKPRKKKPRPCERCGTFAKRKNILGQRLCADCAERAFHPAAQGEMLAGDLFSSTLWLAGTIALPAIAVSLVPDVLGNALDFFAADAIDVGDRTSIGFAIGALASPALTAYSLLLGWRAIRREPLDPRAPSGSPSPRGFECCSP